MIGRASAFLLAGLIALPAPGRAQPAPEGIAPLPTSRPADAANGRRIVTDRRRGLCLLCHSGPFPEERFQGDLAPSLAGAGSRWTPEQLRRRLVEGAPGDGHSLMPAYFRRDGLARVGAAYAGRTILNAEEIEDVVAFLATLRD